MTVDVGGKTHEYLCESNLAFVGLEVMRASLKFQDKLERNKTSSVHDASDERAVHPGVGLGLEGVLQEVLELPHGVGGGRLVLGGEGGALEGVVVVVRVQVHVDAVRRRNLIGTGMEKSLKFVLHKN